jgi:hypothetical protein
MEESKGIRVEAAKRLEMSYRSFRHYSSKYRIGMTYNKDLARSMVARAIQNREIKKPKNCEGCGEVRRLQAHHNDYSMPLQVVWLCFPCHNRKHSTALDELAKRL